MNGPEAIVEAALSHAAASKPESLDAAFAVTAEQFPDSRPEQVLQALAARGFFRGGDVPSLLTDAALDANAGLCWKCFAHVASPISSLSPAANLSHGRLNADGAIIEVHESWLGRRVTMTLPGKSSSPVEIEPLRLHPRVWAVVASAVVFALCIIGVLVWPVQWLSPLVLALILAIAGWGFYFAVLKLIPRFPAKDRVAIDAAWRELVPRIEAATVLVGLCRASIGRGDAGERAKRLRELIEHAAEASNPDPRTLQLLAAARVLHAFDGADLGKDIANSLAIVFEPFFEGELPVCYAEAAAQTVLESGVITSGDLLRLRILLLENAFEARFSPADVHRLLEPLRFLRRLLKPPDSAAWDELYTVGRGLPAASVEKAGTSVGIFDLVRNSPTLSRKLLTRWPDALLRILLPEAIQKGLGEVILTPRGLFLDDLLIEESDATIEIERSPTGSGWYLALGRQKIPVDRKPPLKVAEALAEWLDFRRIKLLPAARREVPSAIAKLRRIELQSLAECPHCGTVNIVKVGEVGEPFAAES